MRRAVLVTFDYIMYSTVSMFFLPTNLKPIATYVPSCKKQHKYLEGYFAPTFFKRSDEKIGVSPSGGGVGGGETRPIPKNFRLPTILLVIFLHLSSSAQQPIITTATNYITHNQFAQANHYLDSILKQNPKTIDALMMKGNVLLNQAWGSGAKSHFNTEKAESIFDSSAIDESYFTPIISLDTSEKIDSYWKQCLALDSARTDIKKGLCSLYSLSLRTTELERQLIQMQNIITENEDNAYLYAEYARNLKNRGRFDDALQVYALIANMFPNLAGIRCDMAYEYFYAGKMNEALAYADSALSKKEVDQTTFINAAALYSELGYYDKAYETFKRYSEKDTLIEADFYKGLMMFANMDSGFYKQLQNFIDHATEQSYYDEIQLAKKLLPYGRIPFTLEDYYALATNEKISRYYRILILQRGVNQFKTSFDTRYLLANFYCSIKNYAAAFSILEPMTHEPVISWNVDRDKQDMLVLNYSFALYRQGEKKKAADNFPALFSAHNNFVQQAAKYFAGKIDWEAGDKKEANELFQDIASRPPTKYSWLAKGYSGR